MSSSGEGKSFSHVQNDAFSMKHFHCTPELDATLGCSNYNSVHSGPWFPSLAHTNHHKQVNINFQLSTPPDGCRLKRPPCGLKKVMSRFRPFLAVSYQGEATPVKEKQGH